MVTPSARKQVSEILEKVPEFTPSQKKEAIDELDRLRREVPEFSQHLSKDWQTQPNMGDLLLLVAGKKYTTNMPKEYWGKVPDERYAALKQRVAPSTSDTLSNIIPHFQSQIDKDIIDAWKKSGNKLEAIVDALGQDEDAAEGRAELARTITNLQFLPDTIEMIGQIRAEKPLKPTTVKSLAEMLDRDLSYFTEILAERADDKEERGSAGIMDERMIATEKMMVEIAVEEVLLDEHGNLRSASEMKRIAEEEGADYDPVEFQRLLLAAIDRHHAAKDEESRQYQQADEIYQRLVGEMAAGKTMTPIDFAWAHETESKIHEGDDGYKAICQQGLKGLRAIAAPLNINLSGPARGNDD